MNESQPTPEGSHTTPEKTASNWRKEAAASYLAYDTALNTVRQRISDVTGPLNDSIRTAFSDYIQSTLPYLPDYFVVESGGRQNFDNKGKTINQRNDDDNVLAQTPGGTIFKAGGMIAVDIFDHPTVFFIPSRLEMYRIDPQVDDPSLIPGNPEFVGFDELQKMKFRLGMGIRKVTDSPYMNLFPWQQTGNEERLVRIIDANLPQKSEQDPSVKNSFDNFQASVVNRREEVKKIKEEEGEAVKNSFNRIITALESGYQLPEIVHPLRAYDAYYLTAQKRLVQYPKRIKGTGQLDFSKAQDVPLTYWVDESYNFFYELTKELMSMEERDSLFKDQPERSPRKLSAELTEETSNRWYQRLTRRLRKPIEG